ncbi:MAG: OmpH family outer membrane protein [Pseudomonadota bacterium]
MLTRRLLLTGAMAWSSSAWAQEPAAPQSPILTVDSQRLFTGSAFGQRVASEIEARGAALAQENQRIAAELAAEERDLTERRSTLPSDEFRALADAYDEKVQATRRAQLTKSDELDAYAAAQERTFLTAAAPVLEALMREAGALIVLEKDRTLLSATAIEVTDIAIARIDAAIGDGT